MAYLPKLNATVGKGLGGIPERKPETVKDSGGSSGGIDILPFPKQSANIAYASYAYWDNFFSDKGLEHYRMYNNGGLLKSTLTIPFDLSTNSTVVSMGRVPYSIGMSFFNNGLSLINIRYDGTIELYSLTTPYDLNTKTLVSTSGAISGLPRITASDTSTMTKDGKNIYILGAGGNVIYHVNMSTAFYPTTATYISQDSVLNTETGYYYGITTAENSIFVMQVLSNTAYRPVIIQRGYSDMSDLSTFDGVIDRAMPCGYHMNNTIFSGLSISYKQDGENIYFLYTDYSGIAYSVPVKG